MSFLARLLSHLIQALFWSPTPKRTPVEEFLNDEISADKLWRDYFERCWELESHTKR